MELIDLLRKLDRKIGKDRRRLLRYDAYYEGEQPLRYMAPALEAEIGDRVTQLVLNWPRMCVDAYEHRLDIEQVGVPGLTTPTGQASMGDELWEMFQANDGVTKYTLGHIEYLVCGRFYAIVGSPTDDNDDMPVLTVEHPLLMASERDARTGQLTSVLKRWQDEERVQWANLYVDGRTVRYAKIGANWRVDDDDEHGAGLPVTEFVNRGRILRTQGVSEFHDVIPVADAANKMATDMMISGEFHATPRRWATGLTKADFVDAEGNPIDAFSAVIGRMWGTAKEGVKFGQFMESDLAVFHNTLKVLAQLAGQLMYLPQDYMSFSSDNPVSAEGQRATESRMIKRAERMQTNLSPGWRKVFRDMHRIKHRGEVNNDLRRLEVVWRDASTPTVAQRADAVVKLTQTTPPIIDVEQAQIDLGYSIEARTAMAERAKARRTQTLASGLAEMFKLDPVTGAEVPAGAAA